MLRELTSETRLSARQIGAQMGKSRNAVIGRALRLGVDLPGANPIAVAKRVQRKRDLRAQSSGHGKRSRAPKNRKQPTQKTIPLPEDARPVKFVDIAGQSRRCKWPIEGDGMNMTVCGANLEPGREGMAASYCDYHCGKATGSG